MTLCLCIWIFITNYDYVDLERMSDDDTGKELLQQDCLSRLELKIKESQEIFYELKFPVLGSIIPHEQTTKYVLVMKHIEEEYKAWVGANWTCSESIPYVVEADPHNHTLIVGCVGSLAVEHPTTKIRQMYPHDEGCRSVMQPQTIAACTMIDTSAKDLIPEWVAYHHLLGFEHFYVYVNGPMDNMTALPYVTYIPFDYKHFKPFFFQMAMQNDCIYRSKGIIKWMALFDVDEFFYVAEGYDLLPYLSTQRVEFAGIQVPNWFFGSRYKGYEDPNATTALEIDQYCWRAPNATVWGREKVFVKPDRVAYFSVHMITLGGPMYRADTNIIRMNHYKLPSLGVYLDPDNGTNLVYDTSMRDRFLLPVQDWLSNCVGAEVCENQQYFDNQTQLDWN